VTIVPDGTPLVVEATVTNQDIGYLKPGQLVEVKVETFPFQKYGSLQGTLVWVSADAEDKNAPLVFRHVTAPCLAFPTGWTNPA
jgi:hemolysin D